MKEGWEYKKFESCLVKVPKQVQVKSKDYKKTGRFPIVSQESELISGYWDDETIVYKHNEPVIIFGDHTKNIKYIDFDFEFSSYVGWERILQEVESFKYLIGLGVGHSVALKRIWYYHDSIKEQYSDRK